MVGGDYIEKNLRCLAVEDGSSSSHSCTEAASKSSGARS